jgi:hypothetical protein
MIGRAIDRYLDIQRWLVTGRYERMRQAAAGQVPTKEKLKAAFVRWRQSSLVQWTMPFRYREVSFAGFVSSPPHPV